jgi:NTE family protein
VVAVDLSWGKLGPYRRANEDATTIPSIFNVFLTSLDIVEMRVARSRLAGEPADVLVTPLLPDFATMDYHRAREAIGEGRAAVERMGPLLEQVFD